MTNPNSLQYKILKSRAGQYSEHIFDGSYARMAWKEKDAFTVELFSRNHTSLDFVKFSFANSSDRTKEEALNACWETIAEWQGQFMFDCMPA